jgi:hypothetical protein
VSERLAGLLPGPRRTLFLRACLLDGDAARTAWRAWVAGAGDPEAAFADTRQACVRLAPLLDGVANGRGSGRLGAAVSASVVREELRWRALEAASGGALAALTAAGVEPVLVGGAAAAVGAYARPWQRHCHDVDLVVHAGERDRATRSLIGAGWLEDRDGTLAHASGTRIALHVSPLRSPSRRLSVDDLRTVAASRLLGGERVRVAAPEHLLLRASEGAFVHAGRSLAWAADVAVLARSLDEAGWERVVAAAMATGSATAAATSLAFLGGDVGLPLPAGPVAELASRVDAAGEAACVALVPRTSRRRRLRRRLGELARGVGA